MIATELGIFFFLGVHFFLLDSVQAPISFLSAGYLNASVAAGAALKQELVIMMETMKDQSEKTKHLLVILLNMNGSFWGPVSLHSSFSL